MGRIALFVAIFLLGMSVGAGLLLVSGAGTTRAVADDSLDLALQEPGSPMAATPPAFALVTMPVAEDEPVAGPSRTADLDGQVRGQVRTLDGHPVEGVLVEARPDGPVQAGGPWSTRTGSNGAFTLTVPVDRPVRLMVEKHGYQIRAYDRTVLGNVFSGDTVDFVASLVARLPLQVLHPDGFAVDHARLQYGFRDSKVSAWLGWSREAPVVELPAGPLWVQARVGDFTTAAHDLMLLPGDNDTVELTLEVFEGIRGVVHFPASDTNAEARVQVIPVPANEPVNIRSLAIQRISEFAKGGGARVTAQRPGFLIRQKAGTYVVMATRGGILYDSDRVTVQDGLTSVELTVPPLGPLEDVVVHLLGPGSVPMDHGVRFSLTFQLDWEGVRNKRTSSAQSSRLPSGGFRVKTGGMFQAVLAGAATCVLTVQPPDCTAQTIDLTSHQGQEYTLHFTPVLAADVLEVEVTNYEGSGYEGLLTVGVVERAKSAKRPLLEQRKTRLVTLDAEGRARVSLRKLKSGSVLALVVNSVSAVRGNRGMIPVIVQSLPQPTTMPLSLTMPALHTVTVQFSGATVPTLFHLTRLDDVLPAKITVPNLDRSLTVYVNSLPPGTYEVAVGGKKRNIEVSTGMTVDWQ